MMLKPLLLLAMLLVAANGSDIYATLYPGFFEQSSPECGNVGSTTYKLTLDKCTQILLNIGTNHGTLTLYGLTTYDSQSSEYYTTYSLESDCSMQFVSSSSLIDTCKLLEMNTDKYSIIRSQRFSDAYDTDAYNALDCTTKTVLVATYNATWPYAPTGAN